MRNETETTKRKGGTMKECERCGVETATKPDEVGNLAAGQVVGGLVTVSAGGTAQWVCDGCRDTIQFERTPQCVCETKSDAGYRKHGWIICGKCSLRVGCEQVVNHTPGAKAPAAHGKKG